MLRDLLPPRSSSHRFPKIASSCPKSFQPMIWQTFFPAARNEAAAPRSSMAVSQFFVRDDVAGLLQKHGQDLDWLPLQPDLHFLFAEFFGP
jgi:hypothetical protein